MRMSAWEKALTLCDFNQDKLEMSGKRDFWIMTRRERQGTIVVLAVIALLLVITVAVRSCRDDVPIEAQSTQLIEFEAEIDSLKVTEDKKPHKVHRDKAKSKNKKKKKHSRPSSPAPRPRPVDPVPQF